jgi:hypothetical protein
MVFSVLLGLCRLMLYLGSFEAGFGNVSGRLFDQTYNHTNYVLLLQMHSKKLGLFDNTGLYGFRSPKSIQISSKQLFVVQPLR